MEQAQSCVKTHVRDLKTYAHDAEFEATVNEEGAIQSIRMRNSTLHHEQLESCLMQALTALPIPPSAVSMRASGPVSGGESTRDSRKPLGIAQALGGAIAFGPIFVVAAGVTLGVYIVAVAAEEAIDIVKRTKKLEKWCDALTLECLANMRLPPGSIFGTHKDCGSCQAYCYKYGQWENDKCPRPN